MRVAEAVLISGNWGSGEWSPGEGENKPLP